MSASTQAALNYLKKIKPSDGWSSEARSTGGTITTVRLLRRNVPLTESYFLDLHYDTESGNVVGILTPNRDGKAQAQILVDKNGKPQGSKTALLRVSNWTPGASPPKTTERSTSSTSRSSTGAAAAAADTSLSLEENKELLKYVAYAIGGAVAFRLIFSAMLGLYVLAFPIVYLYLVQNCPKMESFNAKKELKRVLRGVHLADDNPNKPKGFFNETFARINATLTTEIATGLGYEIEMFPLAGAAYVAAVRVPASRMDCYWIGACNRWYYVWSRELPDAN